MTAQPADVSFITPDLRALDDQDVTEADNILVLSAFSDDRPLRGLAGLVDWRLCGTLSRFIQSSKAIGDYGERVLLPSGGRLPHAKVLMMGLGPRAQHRADRAMSIARDAAKTVVGLGCHTFTSGLFGLEDLPTPLDRTAPDLVSELQAIPEIHHITLVTAGGEMPRSETLVLRQPRR